MDQFCICEKMQGPVTTSPIGSKLLGSKETNAWKVTNNVTASTKGRVTDCGPQVEIFLGENKWEY